MRILHNFAHFAIFCKIFTVAVERESVDKIFTVAVERESVDIIVKLVWKVKVFLRTFCQSCLGCISAKT